MNRNELVSFDIECYKNYLLVMFKRFSDGKVLAFEKFNDSPLNINSIKNILSKYTMISFNGNKYDHLIILAAVAGFSNKEIHRVSKFIIDESSQPWQVRKQFAIKDLDYDHIDLIEVAPLKASLKIYAGRLHAKKMQDLPIHHTATIKESDLPLMRKYCENDNDDNILLFDKLTGEIELREKMSEEYHTDVRSKSDAQIAEAVIKHELQTRYEINPKRPKVAAGTEYYYDAPDCIRFETHTLQHMFEDFKNNPFKVSSNGHVELPEILARASVLGDKGCNILLSDALNSCITNGCYEAELTALIEESNSKDVKSILRRCTKAIKDGTPVEIPKKVNIRIIKIGDTLYKIGVGGLHSMEESVAHIADDNTLLKDFDVASYYPRIILNNNLTPKHLGQPLLNVYRSIVDKRLKAKAEGNKTVADSLKITINGSFGKFASKWSFLYSPDLMMQVTVTGQLCLLMLIEQFELNGISAVSANTDGVVVKITPDQEELAREIVADWEFETDYVMEETMYSGLYSRDVNNYIAIKTNGDAKSKGAYATGDLRTNPSNEVCVDAVKAFIKHGTPIAETILCELDITKFVTVRTVNGGALYEGDLVGKAIRWYYADDELGAMVYKTSGNKVPRSDGAVPIMDLPDQFPQNVDYAWYIQESESILKQIGV